MKSATATKSPNGHGSLYKEVRFSPTPTPVRRSQSVPDTYFDANPSHMRGLGNSGTAYSVVSAEYLSQVRSLLDRQRSNFENERKLFHEERQLWVNERALLTQRISELESLLRGRGSTGAAATSTAATGAFASNPFSAFHNQFGRSLSTELPDHSHPTSTQVWEGSSPGSRPTRVFPDAEKTDHRGLTSIPEQGGNLSSAPSLDAALFSPQSHAADPSASACVPVPIERLDSKLDGITLKSSALPPEVLARVITPPSPPSLEDSPSLPCRPSVEQRNSLKLKLSQLGPPTLKGPLSLLNEAEHDSGFLKELDQKLLDQVRQALGYPQDRENQKQTEIEPPSQGEPELKFKNTTNFGTAFGNSDCRKV
ncbi:hypothetical protein BO70DRAFT_364248 [Aspergillus heteromorphus CBS 117.55]|uniref:Uncharacterized protein n=1 Tax=Aspergillus heteromorphus CBS 117.55 TaxID=1448321 RepID=A0A317VNK0_9EURO|nr:uncharacterized protein BO70DRAFT_364248 [Aspergillus heteromorphus CBS 117.55]PWY75169.1 hypothetical protein BO70DRAFT_364248 [Aspergillus heteromorphus CBS 117.55]